MNGIIPQHIQYIGKILTIIVILQNNRKSVIIVGFCRIGGEAIA